MHIRSIPMWTGKGNNYAYILSDEATQEGMIIDPANPPEVLPVLKSLIPSSLKLTGVINTHHHRDHAGGNSELLKIYLDTPVIGGKDCDAVTKTPKNGEVFQIGKSISVKALYTPCHTQDSICYHVQDGEDNAVFTGDTLFIGGCGRFFEGTAPEMHEALNVVLAKLPNDTRVFVSFTRRNI
ncbi:MAG: Cytoplasmic glyoxalase II [Vezdaea aestivalis]|nr:MAG: Cytoplasmic glyoxalase II [Vezdaea aestivalis]